MSGVVPEGKWRSCRRRGARHRFPVCPFSGKVRLGEPKDVRLALRDIRRHAAAAALTGVESHRKECRGYRCGACRGWHLTSQARRSSSRSARKGGEIR